MADRQNQSEPGRGQRLRRLLHEAFSFHRVVSDTPEEGGFAFALGGAPLHPSSRRPTVEIIDDAALAHWHERPAEDRDPVLWFTWDEQGGEIACHYWPLEIWPEPAIAFLGSNRGLAPGFLAWTASRADLDRESLSQALSSGRHVVVREAHGWFSEFLRQTSPALSLRWDAWWCGGLPLEPREFRSEKGELEAVGLRLDSRRDPALQAQLSRRLILCVVALPATHQLAQELAKAFPRVRGEPSLLAWAADLPKDSEDTSVDPWLESLRRVDALYLKARSSSTSPEELVADIERLAEAVWGFSTLRGVHSVLKGKGSVEQVEDIDAEGVAAGWQALDRYSLFRLRSRLKVYVRRDIERAMSEARRAEAVREADKDLTEEMSDHDEQHLSSAEASATLQAILARPDLSPMTRQTLAHYAALARAHPRENESGLCRLLARQLGMREGTVRQRLMRAKKEVRKRT